MVAITYVIVRKDLPSFIPDPRAQSLLVVFLKSLYDSDFISKCQEDYLFLPVPENLREIALKSIESLTVSSGAPTWIKEVDVSEDGSGTGEYVISNYRSLASVGDIATLTKHSQDTKDQFNMITEDLNQMKKALAAIEEAELARLSNQLRQEEIDQLIEDIGKRADLGFIIAIASLSLAFLCLLMLIRQQTFFRRNETKSTTATVTSRQK